MTTTLHTPRDLRSGCFSEGPAQLEFCESREVLTHIAHLRQHCHNSKFVIFQEKILKVLKCYSFLWVQWRHNWSPAVSFANCVMTPYLLKLHMQTFLSIPIIRKCQILSCTTLVANERHVHITDLVRCYVFSNGGVHKKNWRLYYATKDKNTMSCLLNWRRIFS